jgi:hypothetical protein
LVRITSARKPLRPKELADKKELCAGQDELLRRCLEREAGYGQAENREKEAAMTRIRFSAALLFGVPIFASTTPEPRLEVLVYNHAGVTASIMAPVADLVTSIFERAGTTLVWRDCPGPECPETFSPNSLVVKVIRRENRSRMNWPSGACGVAALASAGPGFYAFIDYDCVVASGTPTETSSILGHAIAHEIGHLLLGDRSHSVAGVMKGRWGVVEKIYVQQRRLFFGPEESVRIRDALRRRVARRATLISVESGHLRSQIP